MNKHTYRSLTGRTIIALLGGLLAAGAVHGGTAEEEIAALRAQMAELDQKLRILERKQELDAEEKAAAAKKNPVMEASLDKGFSITSADKANRLRVRGAVQADGRFFIGDDVPNNETFVVRRVRPLLEGTIAEKYGFRIMPDLAGNTFTLQDAYVTYQHSDALTVLVGKAKSPFDLERLANFFDILFMERAYPTSLAPNRDNGIQLSGTVLDGRLGYQVAWLNGARDGDSTVSDTENEKDIVARLFAHPFNNSADSPLQGLGIGVAASTGERESTAPVNYRTIAQQTFFSWESKVEAAGENTRIEPQFYWYYGPYGLFGSWISSRQEVALAAAREKITNTAWFLAGQWVITGEDASYRGGVIPDKPFSLADGNWGAWEFGLRYSVLDIDDAVFPVFANPDTSATKVAGYSVGINWYLNRNVKASLNFEHSEFTGGAKGKVTQDDENAVLSRVQLRF